MERYKAFRINVIETIIGYKLPVITLGRETLREAVCKVFENVNTGGVALTVFELVTAAFATYEFDLKILVQSVCIPYAGSSLYDSAHSAGCDLRCYRKKYV